jgi:hypothetical protein
VTITTEVDTPVLQLSAVNPPRAEVGATSGVWRLRIRPDVDDRDKARFHPQVQRYIDGSENPNSANRTY